MTWNILKWTNVSNDGFKSLVVCLCLPYSWLTKQLSILKNKDIHLPAKCWLLRYISYKFKSFFKYLATAS